MYGVRTKRPACLPKRQPESAVSGQYEPLWARPEDLQIAVEGEPWLVGGEAPRIHADGIALDRDGGWLYYQALSGTTLYRVPAALLRDAGVPAEELAAAVEQVAAVGPSDGLLHGPDGAVYLTSLERNAIRRVWPGSLSLIHI